MTIQVPGFVRSILAAFDKGGYEIYIVGGSVRDLLMSRQVADWDFTTSATPEQILDLFPEGFYDNAFGTVGLVDPGDKELQEAGKLDKVPVYEVTTFRKEIGYSDRRHPDKVEWGKTLEEDLMRRDFTINALALKFESGIMNHESGEIGFELIDLYDGQEDLKKRLVRAVGDPKERFAEDSLRMMRAVRIAAQLGFMVEKQTLEAIQENADLIKQIAAERVRDELLKLLSTEYPADGVRILAGTGLMEYIVPEILDAQGVDQSGHHTDDVWDHSLKSLQLCPSQDPIVRLATLLHDVGKPASRAYVCKKCGIRFRAEATSRPATEGQGILQVKQLANEAVDGDLVVENTPPSFRGPLSRGESSPAGNGGTGLLVCPQCGFDNDYYESVTFYNHEMVGAKKVSRIADRLRLSNKQKEKLVQLVRWHMFSVDERQTEKAIRRFIKNVGKENLEDILALRTGDRLGGGARETSWRLERFKKLLVEVQKQPFEVRDLKVDGHDVMELLEMKPGKKIGEILNLLYEEVEDKKLPNERDALLFRMKELADSGID